ncbi:MAG TPA: hypothetical protein VKZ49_05390 [Polyangiaceae bacterium]|nr:hypothetical protein [Polyangiaceae bacterium]
MTSFPSELRIYVGRYRQFTRRDVWAYGLWVGLMLGLFSASFGFLMIGTAANVAFPTEAWLVPAGAATFAVSIAVDTIGHLTIYKEEIRGAEGLVHAITIFCGVGASVLLCAAYDHREALWIPALVLTILSFVYSLVDEAFHWRRYVRAQADRVEMWSHVGILVGHSTMMIAWWWWFWTGYGGVAETLQLLSPT